LLNQLADAVRARGDRFAVRNLRFARVGVHFELAKHPVADDFQVQLTHPGDDGLACVFVRINPESRVFFRETLQSDAHFFLIQFCLGFNGH